MVVIDQFLANWKEDARIWHMEKFDDYAEESDALIVMQDRLGYHTTRPSQTLDPEWIELNRKFDSWKYRLGKGMMGVLFNMMYIRNQNRINSTKVTMPEWLDGHLDREVDRKRHQLISSIEKKAGKIVDAKGLYIASDLNINGVVVGDKETVSVYTIMAGGHNIQCLHYRILVKVI